MSTLRVTVRAETCMASGACRRAAPRVFGATGDGWVTLLDPAPVGQDEQVRAAAQSCPVAAIDVEPGDESSA
ncbi:MAG: ferredoxin [Actinomycetota bacterium]|nr:ferredoxin [Actinomycetota bacterium]